MKKDNLHSSLLSLVGVYILFIAYHLYEEIGKRDNGMSPMLSILFIVIFGSAGIGILIYSGVVWFKAEKKRKQELEASSIEKEENSE